MVTYQTSKLALTRMQPILCVFPMVGSLWLERRFILSYWLTQSLTFTFYRNSCQLSWKSSNPKKEGIIIRVDPCPNASSYSNPTGTTLVGEGATCQASFKWSHKTDIKDKHEALVWSALSPDESYVLVRVENFMFSLI